MMGYLTTHTSCQRHHALPRHTRPGHAMSDNIFWQVKVGTWSASSMLAALLQDGGTLPPQLVVDRCEGLPCSPATVGHADCVSVPPPHA